MEKVERGRGSASDADICLFGRPGTLSQLHMTFGESRNSLFPFSSIIWTCPSIHPTLSGALVHLGDREDHLSRTKRVCMGFEPLILVHYCRPP